jgi:hypothetical protein
MRQRGAGTAGIDEVACGDVDARVRADREIYGSSKNSRVSPPPRVTIVSPTAI